MRIYATHTNSPVDTSFISTKGFPFPGETWIVIPLSDKKWIWKPSLSKEAFSLHFFSKNRKVLWRISAGIPIFESNTLTANCAKSYLSFIFANSFLFCCTFSYLERILRRSKSSFFLASRCAFSTFWGSGRISGTINFEMLFSKVVFCS